MKHGIQIKKNKNFFIFFFIFFVTIFYSNSLSSLTVLGALNKVSGKISKIKIENNEEINFGTLKIVV